MRIVQIVCLLIFLSSCSNGNDQSEPLDQKDTGPIIITAEDQQLVDIDVVTSLWLVDWKYESGIEEATRILGELDNVLLFTTYFNELGELHQTENAQKLIDQVMTEADFLEKEVYITVINDQLLSDGTSIQKDPALLESILLSHTSRDKHIEHLLELADKYLINGIEIDYENIPEELVAEFLLFINELADQLTERDLSLRVVLEPRFPVENHALPTHIEFVVMAYNLHGYGTSPGPKANFIFLDDLINKFPNDHGNIGFALATGGFSWIEETVKSLTNEDIQILIDEYQPEIERDSNSSALSFTYREDNVDIEVWYADETTLKSWSNYLINNGQYTDLSIWRAGGLTEENLSIFEYLSGLGE